MSVGELTIVVKRVWTMANYIGINQIDHLPPFWNLRET